MFSIVDVPKFQKLPKDVTTEEGKTVEFFCDVMGDPPIKVQWSKEDGAVSFGRYMFRTARFRAVVGRGWGWGRGFFCNDQGSVEQSGWGS